jgi:hypothetical protein
MARVSERVIEVWNAMFKTSKNEKARDIPGFFVFLTPARPVKNDQ